MSKFRLGDVVRLRSGSPRLVVTEIVPALSGEHERDAVSVAWIVYGTGTPQDSIYPASCLKLEARAVEIQ